MTKDVGLFVDGAAEVGAPPPSPVQSPKHGAVATPRCQAATSPRSGATSPKLGASYQGPGHTLLATRVLGVPESPFFRCPDDEAYKEARRHGYEIVHPLTEEPWGVRRFFVRAPDGTLINVVNHVDE